MIQKTTLLSFFLLTSFFVNAQYSINGNVVGFANGTKVYIAHHVNEELVKVDSTKIKNNTFTINSNSTPEIDLYFIELDITQEYLFPFIMESGLIKFSFDKDNPSKANVGGTKNNDLMTSYNEEAFKIQDEIITFQKQNQDKFMEAQQKGDQATMESLINHTTKLQQKYVDQNKKFIITNKDSYISLLLLTQLAMSDALTIDETKKYYNNLKSEVKETKKGKEFLESIEKLEIAQKENGIKQQKI